VKAFCYVAYPRDDSVSKWLFGVILFVIIVMLGTLSAE
jgi:hypothetical protein